MSEGASRHRIAKGPVGRHCRVRVLDRVLQLRLDGRRCHRGVLLGVQHQERESRTMDRTSANTRPAAICRAGESGDEDLGRG